MTELQTKKIYLSGNRCGFIKTVFRVPTPSDSPNLPKFITSMQQKILSEGIPSLHLRAERDEAVRAVVAVLLEYTDLWSCCIGMPTSEGWLSFGWRSILKRLPWISENRLWNVLRTLKEADLFDSNQCLADPRYITRDHTKPSGYAISRKFFTKNFWKVLGQTRRLKHEAEAKARRVADGAAAIGKKVKDFYSFRIAGKNKLTQFLAIAGMEKNDQNNQSPSSQNQPSARSLLMIITGKLLQSGCATKDCDKLALSLLENYGPSVAEDPLKYLS